MSKAIIIDDELHFVESLKVLIDLHCPQIKIIDVAPSVKEGITLIKKQKPDLIFLDIDMPDGDGFDVLEKISGRDFEVIFTISYNEFAIRAFEFSALNYLIKPINPNELKKVIMDYEKQKNTIHIEKRLNVLDGSINRNPDKIIIPDSSGLRIVEVNDIIRCSADKNYTTVFFVDGKSTIVSRPICHFENVLTDINFVRVHNSDLVNLKYVDRYLKGKGGYVVLSDGTCVNVSVRKKHELFRKMNQYALAL